MCYTRSILCIQIFFSPPVFQIIERRLIFFKKFDSPIMYRWPFILCHSRCLYIYLQFKYFHFFSPSVNVLSFFCPDLFVFPYCFSFFFLFFEKSVYKLFIFKTGILCN